MTLTPWESLAGIRDLQRELGRIIEGTPTVERAARYPRVNVTGNPGGLVITADLPGVNPADLEISLNGKQLTIRGELKNAEPEGEGVTCHLRERVHGPFSRTFTLPYDVEEANISAKYDQGVLTIELPRAEKSKPRTIPVLSN